MTSEASRRRHSEPDVRRTRARATAALGVALPLLLTGAIGVDRARAGTYVMRNCDVPDHGNSLIGPWHENASAYPTVTAFDACASGGGAGFRISGQLSGGGDVAFVLTKPATGPQSQIRLVKAVVWYAARLAGSGPPLRFYSGDTRSDGIFHSGVSNNPPGSENLVLEQLLSPDTRHYVLGLKCGPDGVSATEPCDPVAEMPLQIRGMEVTLSEDIQPIVSQPGGTLLRGGPQTGIRTVTYDAADAQSGIAKVDVLLDDVVVASHDLVTRCVNSDFTPCPASDDGVLQVDTRTVPNGPHSLKLRVADAAGNQRVLVAPRVIDVANAPGPDSTTARAYALTARFKGSSRSTLTVPFGGRVSLLGHLTGGSQPSPAAIRLAVLETIHQRGMREVVAAQVATKADGSFSYVVPTNRPSRTLRLAYLPSDGSSAFSKPLRVRVRAASSLRAELRGLVIRFSGRVRSGPIPKRGKSLRMEGTAPGSAWKSFARLRTDRRGRFSGTYRLRVRRPGVKLKIRVVVPGEDGYPYVSSRSRSVTLRVR